MRQADTQELLTKLLPLPSPTPSPTSAAARAMLPGNEGRKRPYRVKTHVSDGFSESHRSLPEATRKPYHNSTGCLLGRSSGSPDKNTTLIGN